jgi:hypothetical protein
VRCVRLQIGATCLHIARSQGHAEVVKHLCAHGGEKLLMLAEKGCAVDRAEEEEEGIVLIE